MLHLSIEGMDGVGKTSTCKELAERLGYTFVEKPLHYLLDEDGETKKYQELAKKVNSDPDRNFTAWYYGLNNLYVYDRFRNENIVTDRHIVSNYCWSGTDDNKDIYDLIIKKIGFPTLTVILYADQEAIRSRLKIRNKTDKDLERVYLSEGVYHRMIQFCRDRKMPFFVVDSSNLTKEETVDIILKEYSKYQHE